MKLGVLVFPIPERWRFTAAFLETIRDLEHKDDLELFAVYPKGEVVYLSGADDVFSKVHVLELQEDIPQRDEVIIKCNSAMKHISRHFPYIDAVLMTHLECLNGGVIRRCFDVYNKDAIILFQAWKMKEDGTLEPTPMVHHKVKECYWIYSGLVPVQGFMDVGGIDERLADGYGGGDDQLAFCWLNSGRLIGVDPTLWVIHQYHPPATNGTIEPDMKKNWDIVKEYKRDYLLRHSNVDRQWGKVRIKHETFSGHSNPVLQ